MSTGANGLTRSSSRMESMAYPKATTSTMFSKVQYCVRRNTKAALVTLAFFVLVVVAASDYLHDLRLEMPQTFGNLRGTDYVGYGGPASPSWGGAVRPGQFFPPDVFDAGDRRTIHFAAVSDMDQLSKIEGSSKPTFKSIMQPGYLKANGDGAAATKYEIFIDSGSVRDLVTKHNEAGRGAEFSELTLFNDRLITADDRTGDVFEILNTEDGEKSFVVPRFVVTEGTGETDKGMKWEWSTVKNGNLYLGSMGKEYTDDQGNIVNLNNLWVAVINGAGALRRLDWTKQYQAVRKALDAEAPGYLIIEAVNWSEALNKWVFLPRRISQEQYNDVTDEHKGGDRLVLMDENFDNPPQIVRIKMEDPLDTLRGFSSFAFVPGTNDKHALAIRSVEEDCAIDDQVICKQRSYFIVFDVLTGEVLSDQFEYPTYKMEGVEFVNVHKPPAAPSSIKQ